MVPAFSSNAAWVLFKKKYDLFGNTIPRGVQTMLDGALNSLVLCKMSQSIAGGYLTFPTQTIPMFLSYIQYQKIVFSPGMPLATD